MTALDCRCPELPGLGPRDPIPMSAITCTCCGRALELTCPGACGKRHVRASIAATRPARQRVALASPRVFADKPCKQCGAVFTPRGPNARFCPRCKGGA